MSRVIFSYNKFYCKIFITDEVKKEIKQEVKQENIIQEVNIKQESQPTNSLSPSMRPPPEKKFKPA